MEYLWPLGLILGLQGFWIRVQVIMMMIRTVVLVMFTIISVIMCVLH